MSAHVITVIVEKVYALQGQEVKNRVYVLLQRRHAFRRCGVELSTQPGHPFVGRCDEYQSKGGDALRLGSKGRYCSCVSGR